MEDVATAEISRSQVWQWIDRGLFTRDQVRAHVDDWRDGQGGGRRGVRGDGPVRASCPSSSPCWRTTAFPSTVPSELTKADEIALAIEEAIVSGELAPGTLLRQEDLSERFAVSRTPIREALRRLSALGLASFEPNRGARVRTLTRQELQEAFLVRAELEGLATEIAAQRMDDAGLEELVAAERRFHRLTDELRSREPGRDRRSIMADWVRANHAFHDVIYRIADVPYVERIAKSARRTFSGPAVWAPGRRGDRAPLRRQRRAAPVDPPGPRRRQPVRARVRSPVTTCSPRSSCSRRSSTRSAPGRRSGTRAGRPGRPSSGPPRTERHRRRTLSRRVSHRDVTAGRVRGVPLHTRL